MNYNFIYPHRHPPYGDCRCVQQQLLMTQFNVIWWDFNKPEPEYYDVLPYFRNQYNDCEKKNRPVTKEQWLDFVRRKGMYMYWARCEYEIIVSQWPPTNKTAKIDVWWQIENNIDLIADILMGEVEKKGGKG